MKKFTTALVAFACSLGCVVGLAGCSNGGDSKTDKEQETPTAGLEYTLNTDGESYGVTGIGTATDTKIVISAEYEGKPVTNIGKEAFKECRTITSVTIPDSVTVIKSSAFADCSQLKTVKLSSKLEELWATVFRNCLSLETFTLPESVISVGANCFYDKMGNKLPNFNFTEEGPIQYVGTASNPHHALVGSVNNPAFFAITVHKDTKVIADGAFTANSETLENIYFPQELTGINVPRSLFVPLLNGGKLKTEYRYGYYLGSEPKTDLAQSEHPYVACINSNVSNDNTYAFAEGVKIITSDGLKALSAKAEIVIPDGVDSLGEYACYGFNKLTKITLPSSLTLLPRNVFGRCELLKDIQYKGTKAQWNALKKSVNWDALTADYTIHCTDGDIAKN